MKGDNAWRKRSIVRAQPQAMFFWGEMEIIDAQKTKELFRLTVKFMRNQAVWKYFQMDHIGGGGGGGQPPHDWLRTRIKKKPVEIDIYGVVDVFL